MITMVRELRAVPELLANLTRREVKGKYKRTALGQLWSLANPLLYYAERSLEMPRADLREAIREATLRPSRLLMLDRPRLAEVRELGVPHLAVLEDQDWALVRIRKGAKRALEGRPPR